MLGIHELEIFLAAAEHENFSAAARKLHLSQPAISFQIQGLEQQLRVKLFQRTGRRIALTEAGRELLPMAREMISLSARIEESMCAQQGVVKGQLLIGCSTSPGKYILPHLLGAFRQEHPDVTFTVHVMDEAAVQEKLVSRQIQMGVLGLPCKNRDLECVSLFTDELVLIARTDHPWASRGAIEPAEFKGAEWIMRENGSATRELVSQYLAEYGLDPNEFKVAMELGSVEAVETAVEAGYGVAFASRTAMQRDLKFRKICIVNVEGFKIERSIYLARNRRRASSSAQLRFSEFVESNQGQSILARFV